ncbi:MAG: hypothetical protein HY855_06465 [Burkholderiales bacterium]|nr:hypothetical protein [Burkholderiales bacterium]
MTPHIAPPAATPRAGWARGALLAALYALAALPAAQAQTPAAEALRAGFAAARARAGSGLSDRPLYLQSSERSDSLAGEVHALVDQPFDAVRQNLATGADWCRVLMLHLNTKYCRAGSAAGREVLDVGIGRKFDQPLADAHWLRFDFRTTSAGVDHVAFALQSPTGPMSTRDYRIVLEAAAYTERQTLVHMTYAYGYGSLARWATQAYLGTLGSDKVGFTLQSPRPGAPPVPVGGVRGMLERNTMRYYLAIEAHLGAHGLPAAQQQDKRLRDWFDATERYPRQLREIEREAYLDMKQRELKRQDTLPPPAPPRP